MFSLWRERNWALYETKIVHTVKLIERANFFFSYANCHQRLNEKSLTNESTSIPRAKLRGRMHRKIMHLRRSEWRPFPVGGGGDFFHMLETPFCVREIYGDYAPVSAWQLNATQFDASRMQQMHNAACLHMHEVTEIHVYIHVPSMYVRSRNSRG